MTALHCPAGAASGKERRATPPEMIPEPNDAEESVRRIRRGCLFSAVIFVALAVLLVSATGNLFFLTLILVALALAGLSRLVK